MGLLAYYIASLSLPQDSCVGFCTPLHPLCTPGPCITHPLYPLCRSRELQAADQGSQHPCSVCRSPCVAAPMLCDCLHSTLIAPFPYLSEPFPKCGPVLPIWICAFLAASPHGCEVVSPVHCVCAEALLVLCTCLPICFSGAVCMQAPIPTRGAGSENALGMHVSPAP